MDAITKESNGYSDPDDFADRYCFDDEYVDEPYCYDCGGRGEIVVCSDDLCHGQEECIHGDPPVICHACKGRNLL